MTLKVRAVDDLKAQFPLALLLSIVHLPRSTFYDRRRRLSRRDTQTDIKDAVRGAFEAANSASGYRRILSALFRQGWKVPKKAVLRLMRELGLACPVRRRKRYNSFRGEVGEAAENVLNRQFAAEAAHTKWATEVTAFNIGSSKVYISPILDLHDHRIISARVGPSPSVKMVTDRLPMAIDTLNAGEKPLVRSDQGFQYRHTLWRDTLREAGLTRQCPAKAPASTTLSWRDSSVTSRRNGSASRNRELSTSSTTRIQQRLGYLSPDEYRAQTSAIA